MSNVKVALGSAALDSQLVTVYKNSMTSLFVGPLADGARREFVTDLLKPIDSFDPVKGNLMRNGGPQAANLPPVQFKMLQRLTTVIAQAAFGNGSTRVDLFKDVIIRGRKMAGVMTIRQFMTLDPADQLAAINQAWEKVCTKKSYGRLSRQMFEPNRAVVAPTESPVPSGAVPGAGTGMTVGYVNAGKLPDAFTGLGVGFRVDGSGPNTQGSIDRILASGMTTQLKNRYLMYNLKGWEVEGTIVDTDTNAPRVWATKNDLFNESAVCVSRNLYGATAFPLREMEDEALLWAVDIAGLRGFDTETYQMAGGRQWRPGEKAYKIVPQSNVIGYAKFTKLGAPAEGGWRFKIPLGTTWTFLGEWATPGSTSSTSREAQVRAYMTSQLAAWSGPDRTITGAFDFA